MLPTLQAARGATAFVMSARGQAGLYRLGPWPRPRRRWRADRRVGRAVVRLRVAQRLTLGFLDPVEDALYLTYGLRQLGYPASLHIGRELAPVATPAGYHAWVQCGDEVVSTSLPVRSEYVEVHRAPQDLVES